MGPVCRRRTEGIVDRVIVITGANNGIGLAMTRELLALGDRVAALDLSVENLPAHACSMPAVCDVRDATTVTSVVAQIHRLWGRIDVLVNNACLALFKPFIERSPDEMRCELEVNYLGYVNTIQAVAPIMVRQRSGFIHNVSSGIGFAGMPGMTGYTATKGAIESLTRTLALELAGDGIIVNVMHPPLTRTKSAAGFGVPDQMMADPERVGRALARKVGSRAAYISADFSTALGLIALRHFPVAMGKMLASMSGKAQQTR